LKTGLLFGSFNPIHQGHLIVAEHFIGHSLADEVWLIVSPQNPFKSPADLLPQNDRLEMARLAVESNPRLRISDIEFSLPTPSYTIDTLRQLQTLHPEREFSLIIGEDNVMGFYGWKNYTEILSAFKVCVFPRHTAVLSVEPAQDLSKQMIRVSAPRIEISATMIREHIHRGRSIRYLVPDKVREYITAKRLYAL